AVTIAVAAAGTLAGCSSSGGGGARSASPPSPSPSASSSASGMPGMGMAAGEPMYGGNGLSASDGGFTFTSVESTALAGGKPGALLFRILDSSGMTVTAFQPHQTKLMHSS